MIKFSKITKRSPAYYYHVHEVLPGSDTSIGDLIRYPAKGWMFEPSVTTIKKVGERGDPIHIFVMREIIKFAEMVDSLIGVTDDPRRTPRKRAKPGRPKMGVVPR